MIEKVTITTIKMAARLKGRMLSDKQKYAIKEKETNIFLEALNTARVKSYPEGEITLYAKLRNRERIGLTEFYRIEKSFLEFLGGKKFYQLKPKDFLRKYLRMRYIEVMDVNNKVVRP